jgi:DNA-3-methyladenine glycosylase II
VQVPSADEILSAREALAAADAALSAAHSAVPPFAWRSRTGGFAGLCQMIVSQQVSTAAAAAIWTRLETGLDAVTPQAVLDADEMQLRSVGLSGQKARYVRAIAEAHVSGLADFDTLPGLPDEAAIAALTAIKGVGRWTAELYLLFCEARRDAFPAGDLALQEGLRMAEGSTTRLGEKALYARAEAWRPHRGVAAHLLWAYYGLIKRREGALKAEGAA